MDKTVNFTAIVKSADIRSELAPKIRATYRRTQEDRKQLGMWLLQCKEACLHAGEPWLEWLERETGIPERSARRFMDAENSGQGECDNGHLADDGQDDSEINWVDKQCDCIEWYTPENVLERVRFYFGGSIPLDPCTTSSNHTKAGIFFTKEMDGLSIDWLSKGARGVFVNPPYGKAIPLWAEKIHLEASKGLPIIALLPCGARFSTSYWQEHIFSGQLNAICFARGRLAFTGPDGEKKSSNPYDSAIYGFNAEAARFSESFRPLGKVLTVSSE